MFGFNAFAALPFAAFSLAVTYDVNVNETTTVTDSSNPSAAVAIKSFNAGSSGTVSVSFSNGSSFTRSMLVSVKPS